MWKPRGESGDGGKGSHPVWAPAAVGNQSNATKTRTEVRRGLRGAMVSSRDTADVRFVTMSGWWLASYLVLWALVIALAVLVLALARQIGTLHLRLGPRGARGCPGALHEQPPRGRRKDLLRRRVLGGDGQRQGRHGILVLAAYA